MFFYLYLRSPTVLKKGSHVHINNAKTLLSPLDSCQC